jgi:hypothetical protein
LSAKSLSGIERNTAERSARLRGEIAIAPRDDVHQGTRLRDDLDDSL